MPAAMRTYDLLASLPLTVDSYELDDRRQEVSSGFLRRSTLVRLVGDGHEGVGEDVTYDAEEHEKQQACGPVLALAGRHTLESFSALLGEAALFPEEPSAPAYLDYRRWGFESAALDLALRQAGVPLHEVVRRTPQPITFVVSLRLGEPASIEPVRSRLALYPTLRFKLDATTSWTPELCDQLIATGSVDSIDLKGCYRGTIVDNEAGPEIYRLVAEAFPEAWIEDPRLTPENDEVLRPYRDRITWDAPIHSVADIRGQPFTPRMVNIKPSRFGTLAALFAAYDYCESEGVGAYGGGQFELGVGRDHIQYLASLFHADTPNDIAPTGYNLPEPSPGLPASPLTLRPAATGFRLDGSSGNP
jgi:L-alanine-DL-glutamate epimerase-like enolase superfamily enzyme